ncbi:MAG: hypothetical protein BRD35_08435 [Bacteroidetes bacterium QH_7_62_13]|nr:MAG: hypothetical protein BRD35_08435 [Bacteroidetes bacterium QH_7_62_13]
MQKQFLTLTIGLVLAIGGSPLHAQPHERTVRDTVSVGDGPVSIDNREGSITVSTWGRDEVAYRARIVSEQVEEAVQQTRVDIDRSGGGLSLTTNYDDVEGQWTFGPRAFGYVKTDPPVHYTIRMPESVALQVDDHESDIDVSGLSDAVRIDTHEGDTRITDHSGRAEVSSHEGQTVLREMTGNLIVETHEGAVTVDGLSGRLDLETHDGRADVRIDALKEIVADTHEGVVTLSVPASSGFDLSTDLGNEATLEESIDLSSARRGENDYRGSVRGGGPLLRLTSHEGRITLRSQ